MIQFLERPDAYMYVNSGPAVSVIMDILIAVYEQQGNGTREIEMLRKTGRLRLSSDEAEEEWGRRVLEL